MPTPESSIFLFVKTTGAEKSKGMEIPSSQSVTPSLSSSKSIISETPSISVSVQPLIAL